MSFFEIFSPLKSIKADPDQLVVQASKHLARAAEHEEWDEYPQMAAHASVATAKVQLATYLRTHRN
ncbi:hypothetical protein [Streptomyces sp. NPDC037389]|uniref:hypothetical protein n=1 Tax=Streptomyces sp. NPDC037389 TaxID=3155369 RepID=UPI003409F2B6